MYIILSALTNFIIRGKVIMLWSTVIKTKSRYLDFCFSWKASIVFEGNFVALEVGFIGCAIYKGENKLN